MAKERREREIKTMPAWTKDVSGRLVVGITAVTGNVDDGGDRIVAGAFKKTISENARRIRHLWQHGADGWDYGVTPPIAAIKTIQEVGRDALPPQVLTDAPEATGGLEVAREYLDTPRGNEILAAYAAGIELEMSIGFDAIIRKYVEENEMVARHHWRDLLEIKLYDTSDVNWGMNKATVGQKSFEHRLHLLIERMQTMEPEILSERMDASELLKEFRALCAKFVTLSGDGQRQQEVESRAEPPETRISLTPSLDELRDLELALLR